MIKTTINQYLTTINQYLLNGKISILLDGLNAIFMLVFFGYDVFVSNIYICPSILNKSNQVALIFLIINVFAYIIDIFYNYNDRDEVIHHLITIILILLNLNRLTCAIYVKLIHDMHNIIGMMRLYSNTKTLYIIQSIVFIITRLILFPIFIINSYAYHNNVIILTIIFLSILLIANIKWSYGKIKNILLFVFH